MALFARLVSFSLVILFAQSGLALGSMVDTVAGTTLAPASTNVVIAKAEPDSEKKKSATEKVWRSQELSLLAIGLGVGDVDGDGKN
jgi:hypothetical protein